MNPKIYFWILAYILLFSMISPHINASEEKALVILSSNNIEQMKESKQFIERFGHIIQVFPPHYMIGYIDETKFEELMENENIKGIYTEKVDSIDIEDTNTELVLGYWNKAFEPIIMSTEELNLDNSEEPGPILNDMLQVPLNIKEDKSITSKSNKIFSAPSYYETSEYLYGNVLVSIILPESNGMIDTSREDWTTTERDNVVNEIVDGLLWWLNKVPSNVNLAIYYLTQSGVPTSYEPISRPQSDEGLWIQESLDYLGYPGTDYFIQVYDYNNHLRDVYEIDWAYTVFVVDSSNDFNNMFSDGYFAYAYLDGPFMVMTYGNNGYGINNMDTVMAHETGHIFGAGDEYSSSGCSCTRKYGFLNVENQNCENDCSSDAACIMRGDIPPYTNNNLEYYSKSQVGWRDSDADGINDAIDSTYNTDTDADSDGVVDYWDSDDDNDGLLDIDDGCPNEAGPLCNDGCPDTTAPAIEIYSPRSIRYFTQNILVYLNPSDNGGSGCLDTVWFYQNSEPIIIESPYEGYYGFNEGENNIIFYANDTSGNINTAPIEFAINKSREKIICTENAEHNCNSEYSSVYEIEGLSLEEYIIPPNKSINLSINWSGYHHGDPNYWSIFLNISNSPIGNCTTYNDDANISYYWMNCRFNIPLSIKGGQYYELIVTSDDYGGFCYPNEDGTDVQASVTVFLTCMPQWLLNETWSSCNSSDLQRKNYYDANSCNSGTPPEELIQICNYCTSTWENMNSSCRNNDTLLVNYQYTNTCCQETGLTSDCNIPINTTSTCDYCDPSWTEVNTSCLSSDQIIGRYNDTNNCYSLTNLSSDNNPPPNNTYSCDYCLPNWNCTGYGVCQADDYQYCNDVTDNNSCYANTSLPSDQYSGDYSEFDPMPCDFCTPHWIADDNLCLINDLRLISYHDSYNCGEDDGLPADNGTYTTCNYCDSSWYKVNTTCLINDTKIGHYLESIACCSVTKLDSDCNTRPANITYSCDYCTPDWIEVNTSCQINDQIIGYYEDLHNCYTLTNLSSDNNPPDNNTYSCDYCTPDWTCISYDDCQPNDRKQCNQVNDTDSCYAQTSLPSDQYSGDYSEFLGFCDYDNNGIIGNETDLNTNIGNLSLVIGNSTNLTSNCTGKELKVEFKQNNTDILEFDYNFSSALNLANITIQKQESTAT